MKVKHFLFIVSFMFFTFSIYKHSTTKSCKKQYEEFCQNQLIQRMYRKSQDLADAEQKVAAELGKLPTRDDDGNDDDNDDTDQEVDVIEQIITPKKKLPTVNNVGDNYYNDVEYGDDDTNKNKKGKNAQPTTKPNKNDELELKITHDEPTFNFIGGYFYPNVSLIRPAIPYKKSRKMNKITTKDAQQKYLACSPAVLPKEKFTTAPAITTAKTRYVSNNNKNRLIFCASSGSSDLLSTAKGVDSEQYREPEMKGEWLSMTNNYPMNATKKERAIKLTSIREYLKTKSKGTIYAETSSMFIKTFWDVIADADDVIVDVIALRRYLPHVLIHMIQSGKGEEIRSDEYNTTHSVNGEHKPPLFFPPDAFERLLRYAIDIELRTQKLIEYAHDASTTTTFRVLEVNLKDINTTEGANKLFGDLNLEPTDSTTRAAGVPLPIPYVPTTLAEKRRYLPCSRELSVWEAKTRIFAYLTRLTPENIPVLPQLRAPVTYAGRQPKIAAVTVVPRDVAATTEDTQSILYTHLTNALQFAQTAVVVRSKADERITKQLALPKAVVVDSENFANSLAAFMSVDDVVKPTHVICNDFLVGFSDSFRQSDLLQQLILALEPGEALYVLPSKTIKVKRRHRIVAFAMSKRIVEYIEASKNVNGNGANNGNGKGGSNNNNKPIKFKNLPFENKYYINEGLRELDWYPRYNLVPILNV